MQYVFLATVIFGVLRFIVPVTGAINQADIFKDIAHCFVGGLFGAAILATTIKDSFSLEYNQTCRYLWVFTIGLTILEVVAFILLKSS